MRHSAAIATLVLAAACCHGFAAPAAAQAAAAAPAAAKLPADPWPRDVSIANAAVLIYQPQVNKWDGNQIDFRSALAIKPTGATAESFGVVFATARTQVDKITRMVVFENLNITKTDFPTLPDRGAQYTAELQKRFASDVRTISLDRLQASLALAGVKAPTVVVQNTPPQVLVSYTPAILVPIDGAPVLQAVPGHPRAQRVVNTRALILQGGFGDNYYIHVYDGWLQSSSITGPWTQATPGPLMASEMNAIVQELSKKGVVDLLDGGPKANPKPSLANGVPAIYTSQVPTELVVFSGQPDFVPIVGTQLLWAANTTSDVLVDIVTGNYYVLLAGRWFRGPGLAGPWTFVAGNALPPDFARIPPHSLAGAVLPTVAGTPQAQEAVIENSIPQTATVPLRNGPKFTPNFDGAPQYSPIPGTPLSYVTNTSVPIIQVSPSAFYAVEAGVWFNAPALTGPWTIATSVPAVIYTIPPSSPVFYVTYVRIYEATPQVVYVGYTPGYLGTVVAPTGTVVYGTGYAYSPWIGSVWYAPPYTYGIAATPVYNPYVGYTFGFALGLATAAWATPVLGRRLLRRRILGRLPRLPVLRDREFQRVWALGQHRLLGHPQLVCGRRRCRQHVQRQLCQRAHRHDRRHQCRPPVQRLDRQRHARLRPDDERCRRRLGQRCARGQLQRLYRPAFDRLRRLRHHGGRQHLQSRRGDHGRTDGRCPRGRRHLDQCRHRQDQQLGERIGRQQQGRRRQRQRLPQRRQRLAAARIERLVGRLG